MPMITIFKKEINLRIQRSIETLFVWEWFKYLFNSAAKTRCQKIYNLTMKVLSACGSSSSWEQESGWNVEWFWRHLHILLAGESDVVEGAAQQSPNNGALRWANRHFAKRAFELSWFQTIFSDLRNGSKGRRLCI